MSANIVNLPHSSFPDNKVDGLTMVGYIEPVTNILSLAVDRNAFIVQRSGNYQRDQLLREMVGTVVVGATGNGHRQTEGSVISQYKKVRTSLGRRIGRRGLNRGVLGKEKICSL